MGGAHLHVLDLLHLRFGQVLLRVGVGQGAFGGVGGRRRFWGVLAFALEFAQLLLGLSGEVLVLDQSGLGVAVGGGEGVAFDGARLAETFIPPQLPSHVLH